MPNNLVKVANVGDVEPGGRAVIEVDDVLVALFNVDGEQYYAVEDVCTHDGGPLADGAMVDTYEIECPRHGARFDIRTGQALCMPAFEPVQSYPVVVKEGAIYLAMD